MYGVKCCKYMVVKQWLTTNPFLRSLIAASCPIQFKYGMTTTFFNSGKPDGSNSNTQVDFRK